MMIPILALLLSAPVSGDELLVSSFQPANVQRFDAPSGAFELVYGASPLTGVLGTAIGPDSLVYVASEATNQILRYAVDGSYVDAFVEDDPSTPGDETGGLAGPSGLAFGPDGSLFVGSFNGDSVLQYDALDGSFLKVFVTATSGGLNGPDAGMTFGPDGDLFVPSFWNHSVKRYDGQNGAPLGDYVGLLQGGLRNPRTVLFPGDGFAYVSSEGSDEILRYIEATGAFDVKLVSDDPATPGDETGGLDAPTGMGIGPDGALWVASLNTNEVKRYDLASGTYLDDPVSAGSGGLALPTYLLFRPRTRPTCAGLPNSTGDVATLVGDGSTSVSANRLILRSHRGPANRGAVLLLSTTTASIPFGDGVLCLGSPFIRAQASTFNPLGVAEFALDLTASPIAGMILPGSTWQAQVGFRDPGGPQGFGFNTSNGLEADFSN